MVKGPSVPSVKLSTSKVPMPKVSAPRVASPRGAMRLHQNPFSPVPGNVSASSLPGGAGGQIPIPSVATPAQTTPPKPQKGAPAFSNGGLVKAGSGGNVPAPPKTKTLTMKC